VEVMIHYKRHGLCRGIRFAKGEFKDGLDNLKTRFVWDNILPTKQIIMGLELNWSTYLRAGGQFDSE